MATMSKRTSPYGSYGVSGFDVIFLLSNIAVIENKNNDFEYVKTVCNT